jgi:hypothetical protein
MSNLPYEGMRGNIFRGIGYCNNDNLPASDAVGRRSNDNHENNDNNDNLFLYHRLLNHPKALIGRKLLPQDSVNGTGDGHIGMHVLIDLIDGPAGIVSLCYHVHFLLSRRYCIALANHFAKGAVAAEG